MSDTFAQRNPKSGLIEIIDMRTGHVLAVQRTTFSLFDGHQELLVEHTLPSGEKIKMQKGIDPGLMVHTQSEPFSQLLVDLVCQAIAEGGNLTEVCKRPGMPTYVALSRWRRAHPHIQEQLDQARKDRAEHLRDRALTEADEAMSSKDPLGASALRVETYLKAAGFDDARYSPKAKIEANINVPTQILVSTGINREEIAYEHAANTRDSIEQNKENEERLLGVDRTHRIEQKAKCEVLGEAVASDKVSMDIHKG